MTLWTKQDSLAGAPKYLRDSDNYPAPAPERDYGGLPMQENVENAYLVDTTEAAQAENRAKGLKTPGWNLYKEYGTGRKYVENLVAMKVTPQVAGDLGVKGNTAIEDTVVVDRTITISVQPANTTVTAPATATFTVTAAASPASTLTYQWYKAESTAPNTWAPVGTNSASYTTGATAVAPGSGATNGDRYKVTISASGATAKTSSIATLTVTA